MLGKQESSERTMHTHVGLVHSLLSICAHICCFPKKAVTDWFKAFCWNLCEIGLNECDLHDVVSVVFYFFSGINNGKENFSRHQRKLSKFLTPQWKKMVLILFANSTPLGGIHGPHQASAVANCGLEIM